MKTLKNLFKFEQFGGFNRSTITPEWASKVAQQILDKFIEENGVKVYCSKPDKQNSHLWSHFESKGYDTHQAILLNVQEIKRECAHEPKPIPGTFAYSEVSTCEKCGVKLKATWGLS